MSIFAAPRFYTTTEEPNFSGLFRLIDDFDRYSAQNTNNTSRAKSEAGSKNQQQQLTPRRSNMLLPTFTPKFDLKETETIYVLQGELPGVEKKDLNIEFVDPQTVRVHGKVERAEEKTIPEDGEAGADKESNNKKVKFWITERSVGEFSRSFTFPEKVDHDGVTATLREGVLYLAVPKARKVEVRKKITVS